MNKFWKTSLFFVVLSLVTQLYLSVHNYQLKFGTNESKSLCNISATFNCDAVSLSAYSEVFGVPLALLGLFANSVLLIFLLISAFRLSSGSERVERLSLYTSGLILLASLIMGAISLSLLKTYCLFCMVAYVFSALQFIFIYKAQSSVRRFNLIDDLRFFILEKRSMLLLLLLIPGGAVLADKAIRDTFGADSLKWMIAEAQTEWEQSPVYPIQPEEGFALRPRGPIYKNTLVEYADILCPHCKHAYPKIHAFAEANPEVQVIFKPWPIDGKCNDGMPTKGDGLRCQLAAAAYCAEKINGTGWVMLELLFARQELWTVANFKTDLQDLGQKVKLDSTQLMSCIESDQTLEWLKNSAKSGTEGKISGTPSYFLNGKRVLYGQSLQVLRSLVNR